MLTWRYPQGGMPWGLPTLDSLRQSTLETWLQAGGAGPSAEAQAKLSSPQTTVLPYLMMKPNFTLKTESEVLRIVLTPDRSRAGDSVVPR